MRLGYPDSYTPPRPKVLSPGTFCLAVVLHLLVFAIFVVIAAAQGFFVKKETIIPIDLTVVVNENLDGVDGEPPPLLNPPPPEKPKPKAKKKAEKQKPKEKEEQKPLERMVTNIVTKVEKKDDKKKDKDKKDKDKEKKPDEKKPEPPKKTAAELAKERAEKQKRRFEEKRRKIIANSKFVEHEVPDAKASGNGRTEKRRTDWKKLLNEGYRPGTKNQIATDEKQRCLSLIQMAIEERWDKMMPKVGREGTVLLSVQFNSSGGLVNVRLQKSCGDALSDQAALAVARSVTSIRGLSAEFLSEFRKEPLTIRYRVRGNR